MEGISHEAASLAGHLGLGRLIYVYDDNHITIDGPTEISLSDDAVKRFDAYGWHAEDLGEIANDTDAIEAAIRRAMAVEDKPSFLQLRSHIGWPAPHMTDNPKAHGDPFPPEEIAATKEILGLPADQSFWVPDEVISYYREARRQGAPSGTRGSTISKVGSQVAVRSAAPGTHSGAATASPGSSRSCPPGKRARSWPPGRP